jgi:hypothetical protein
MHIDFSSQVTGFYAQKKVGGTLSQKLSCSALGPARPDSRPDDTAAGRTSPTWDQTAILARVSAWGQNSLAGCRMSGLQPGPAGLTTGPSGLDFGGTELMAEHRRELLPMSRFPTI